MAGLFGGKEFEEADTEFPEDIWEDVKASYHYPPLDRPVMTETAWGEAHLDFTSQTIRVGEDFIREMAEKTDFSREEALEMVAGHEVGHYMEFPRTLSTMMLAGKMLDDFFGDREGADVGFLFNTYADVADDLQSVLTPERKERILNGRREMLKLEDGPGRIVRETIQEYMEHPPLDYEYDEVVDGSVEEVKDRIEKSMDYEEVLEAEEEYGGRDEIREYVESLKEERNEYYERMREIEFDVLDDKGVLRDPNKMRIALQKWGTLVNDMLDEEEQQQDGDRQEEQQGGGRGEGEGQGRGEEQQDDGASQGGDQQGGGGSQGGDEEYEPESGMPQEIDPREIMKDASEQEIKKALRELGDKLSKNEYEQVEEWVKSVREDDGEEDDFYTVDQADATKGIGTSKGELEVSQEVIEYYRELSKNYPLFVRRKPIDTEETRDIFAGVEKWRPSGDAVLAQPELTAGDFLPGVTRKVEIKEKRKMTRDYDVPHLLVAIDSSGSMPDPERRKSHAVLAAYAAARSYYMNDSAIGVINFSGDSFYMPYTREFDEALAAIGAYQGGGTQIDMGLVEAMLGGDVKEELEDEYSDMEIEDLPMDVRERATEKKIELSEQAFEKALNEESIDLMMFTDGGIMNLDEVIEVLEDRASLNRATIVLSDRYDGSVPESTEKINTYKVDKPEDITDVAVEGVKHHLTGYEEA